MHKNKSIDCKNKSVEKVDSWDTAIQDALERITRLRRSIKVFKEMRDSGQPWQLHDQSHDQHHSV